MTGKTGLVLFSLLLSASWRAPAWSAEDERVYICPYVASALKVDAATPDPAWAAAPVMRLLEVRDGSTAKQQTEVRALWSREYLYLWFECEDSDVWGTFTKRDEPICREEVVEVFINPSGDRQAYYEIEISPLGTIFDLFILNGGEAGPFRFFQEWNCPGLQTSLQVRGDTARGTQDDGWTVMAAVPFAEMITAPHRPPEPGDRWRWNLYRIDRSESENEHTAWSPTGAVNFHLPRFFGTLEFAR